jgi:hypothetical protein
MKMFDWLAVAQQLELGSIRDVVQQSEIRSVRRN